MAWISEFEAINKIPRLLINREFRFTFDGIPLVARDLSPAQIGNLLKAGLDFLLRKNRCLSLPPIVQVEPTNLCNLKCPLCPTGVETCKRSKGVMALHTFHEILRELQDKLVAIFLYSYGEPFINPHLASMIEACTRQNILTLTTTNGHFIRSYEEAVRFVEAGLTVLIFAIDGSTQEIYETYRKSGDLETVRRSVLFIEEAKRNLRSNFPYTVIRSVIMQQNQDDMGQMEQLARDLGVNMFAGKSLGCLPESNLYKAFEPRNRILRRYVGNGSAGKGVHCPFPFRQPTIFWDGTVVGSEHDRELEFPFGRIGDQPFSAIWNSANAVRMRAAIREDRNLPLFCANCPHRGRIKDGSDIFNKELRTIP